jgi:glycosyltransferase involved in cell wall biosynthesis
MDMENRIQPLISCICITKNRPNQLLRSVKCFLAQSYKNKELIIFYPEEDNYTREVIKSFENNLLSYPIARSDDSLLGSLRNKAIKVAHGDYICQWDDDDFFHVLRLEIQYYSMQICDRCSFLKRWLIYDSKERSAYLSNSRVWEGSLFARRDFLIDNNLLYPNMAKGEDTFMVERLLKAKVSLEIKNCPFLYIYHLHENNTWSQDHHAIILKRCKKLSDNLSKQIGEIFHKDVDPYASSLFLSAIQIH